jgi:hypothetical protein
MRDHEEAASWAAMAVDANAARYIVAAANTLAGHTQEAEEIVARLRQRDPGLRISML